MIIEILATPGLNYWTVPADIGEVLVELYGAQGGDGANGGSPGGEGGTVAIKVAVTPGDVYRFAIAGAAPTGYALPAHVGGSLVPYMQLHGGDTSCFAFYRTGPTSTVTFANDNGCSIVTSLTLDFDAPVLTHTGAMTT